MRTPSWPYPARRFFRLRPWRWPSWSSRFAALLPVCTPEYASSAFVFFRAGGDGASGMGGPYLPGLFAAAHGLRCSGDLFLPSNSRGAGRGAQAERTAIAWYAVMTTLCVMLQMETLARRVRRLEHAFVARRHPASFIRAGANCAGAVGPRTEDYPRIAKRPPFSAPARLQRKPRQCQSKMIYTRGT